MNGKIDINSFSYIVNYYGCRSHIGPKPIRVNIFKSMMEMAHKERIKLDVHIKPKLTTQLLEAVQFNDFYSFKSLIEEGLKSGSIDLKNKNTKDCLSTVLYECCLVPDKQDFFRQLLRVGVDVNYVNDKKNRAPVHLVAMNGYKGVLRVMLEYSEININAIDDDGNSALHLAVITRNSECSHMLLESKDIQPNLMNKEGVTPVYIAATMNEINDKMMRSFMRCPKVNLDMIVHGEPLTEVIAKKYPQFVPFRYLYLNDESGFISYVTSTGRLDGDDGEYTYLQYACNYGLSKVVQTLLDLRIDPNKILKTNPKQPIRIASFRGFNSIISMFLKINYQRVHYQSNTRSVLHEVIIGSNEKHYEINSRLCNHDRTLEIFLGKGLEKNIFDINLIDEIGNTCLHYAVKIGNIDYIHSLLDSGAYICKKNHLGKTPLDNINYEILESYLNKSVRTNDVSPNQEYYEIICSYKFLCPPKVFKYSDSNTEMQLENQNTVVENIPETEPLLYISDNSELRPLLMHPVFTFFLYQKWMKVKMFYMLNVLLHFGFLIFLTFYIIETVHIDSKSKVNFYLWIIVWVFLIILILRELFQFILSPISFISHSEIWLKLCLIILTLCLLCENFSKGFRIALCIIVIQVSFGEFMCISSRHPILALQWEIFKVVIKNFLSFLVWYSLIIIAFVFCFLVLFKDIENENDRFSNFFLASFNVIIMLTGELDSDSLKTELVINKLVVLLFIFFIPVVLVNILVSLAVSNTQEIKNDAEIISRVSHVHFIYDIEVRVARGKCTAVNVNQSKNFIRKIISFCTWRIGSKLMMFPDALKKPEITIFPNQNNVVKFESFESSSQSSYITKFQRYHVDNASVNKAKLVIKSNLEKRKEATTENIIKDFLNKCIDVENTVKEIRERLNVIN